MPSARTDSIEIETHTTALIHWLTKRRVRISLLTFSALVFLNIGFLHTRPEDLYDWTRIGTDVGCLMVFAGLVIRSWAAGTLQKSKVLTQVGPYALVRNPLYVGSFLMMVGFCVLLRDLGSLLFISGPMVAIYWLTVRKEEKNLAAWFPNEWKEYVRTVPRFIPRSLTKLTPGAWSWRQWLKNREYQAVFATAIGMLAIAYWSSRWY